MHILDEFILLSAKEYKMTCTDASSLISDSSQDDIVLSDPRNTTAQPCIKKI